MSVEVVPAILTDKVGDLKAKLKLIERFGARKVQVDIADGKFVPNKTIGAGEISKVKTNLEIEAHLMVENPERFVEVSAKAGVKTFIFHLEAAEDPKKIITQVRKSGMKVGLALSPKTKVDFAEPYADDVDMIVFLSVEPGFQGRGFVIDVLDKIREFRNRFPASIIGIDGGVKLENFDLVEKSGVNEVVVGSGIWQAKNSDEAYKQFLNIAQNG
ncbi:ribulose-phosphate 3-epimerase [Candidatus Parcubacteria bacterium]|nr:MAG: ribulose-phosphate 3-epimerase [Candidatus Parcubacteria bacterium]